MLLTVRVGLAPVAGEALPKAPTQPVVAGLVASAETEKPLAGARVEIFEQLEPDLLRAKHASGDVLGDPVASCAADSSGHFKVHVPGGKRLIVVAEASGHQRSFLVRPILLNRPGERDLGRLELPAGRRLTGQVLDASGKPVAAAKVIGMIPRPQARRGAGAGFARRMVGPGMMLPFPAATRTAADGGYTLEGLPDRPVTLRAWADKLAPGLAENVRAPVAPTLRLAPGHPLSGKVVAPDGKTAVAGAQVIAGEEGWDGVARTGTDGTFRFAFLRTGPVVLTATTSTIIVSDEKNATVSPSWMFAPSVPLRTKLPVADQSKPYTLKLSAGGIVHAGALDTETRLPVAGSSLTLNAPGEDESRPAVTGTRGGVIFTGVPVGNIRLHAEAEGYLEADLEAAPLASGQTRAWSAALRPAAAVEGTVRDATGRPVAGARVSVLGPPPYALPMRLSIFFPIGVDPVTTDAQGRFALEKLPPKEELKVSVESDGFAPWELAGIKLRAGERRSGMEVLLDGGAMITGRLVNADGQPLAAAAVTASRRREGGPGGVTIRLDTGSGGRSGERGPGRGRSGPGGFGGDELAPVLSGPDGLFRVRGAKPGIWSLGVIAHGYAPKSVAGLKLEELARALDAGDVTLEPGVTLRGRVVNAAGEPIAYARGSLRKEFSVLSTFDTGADGLFVSEDLAPGDAMTLTMDADGYGAIEKHGLTLPTDEMTITLTPSSRITGQLLDRETRRPITDFSIGTSRSRGGGGGGMMVMAMIDGPETSFHSEDGSFALEDVDPGKIVVSARAPGYKDAVLRDLEVPEGKDLEGLAFALDRSGSVAGTVLDDKGRPLPDVVVARKEASGGGMMIRGPRGGGDSVATDGDGNFTLTGLERGPITLSFKHQDFQPTDRDVDTSHDVDGLRVTLSRGATLTGIVLHEEDASPVAGASVSASAAGASAFGGGSSVTTGPDGTFSLEGIAAGRYTLRAESAGLRTAQITDVVVSEGAALPPYELRMGGGVTLSGSLVGVKESDLPQFTVRAVGSAGGGMGGFGTTAPVDATGHFEIKGLTAGSMTLIASSGFLGGKSATRTLVIPDNTPSVETTIEFPHGSKVEGDVTRGGKGIDGASVIFMNNATRARVTASTDTAGHYVAEDLDDGDYSVDVLQMASGISHSTKTSVKGDRELDIELPLARITGIVNDSGNGRPLDGADISVKKENSAQPSTGAGFIFQQGARTDATGSYAIEGLEEGTYTLTARKDGYGFETRAVTITPTLQPDDISFELARVDGFSFRAIDALSGQPFTSLSALVLVGGGDPLAPNGSGATSIYRGQISADATGLFRLDSLKTGVYRIVLGGQNIATETLNDVMVPGPETTLTLTIGGDLEVTAGALKAGETAKGVLLDPQGRPAYLTTFLPEPTFLLRPGESRSLSDIPPGAYRLRVSMPGGGLAEKPVSVIAGQVTRLSIP